MRKLLYTSGAAFLLSIGLGGATAHADALATTPSFQVGTTGTPCVFVGQTTVGNPLQAGPLFQSDPKTGVYTRCP